MTEAETAGAIAAEAKLNLDSALHGVIRLLLARPELQDRLGAEYDPDRFCTALVHIAASHGVHCDTAALQAVLRPDPLGLGRFAPAPVELPRWPGPGWLPARSVPSDGEPAFDWLWFGRKPLSAPFHEDDVRRAGALPLNWLLRTRLSLSAVTAGAPEAAAPPLRGLILHMSRCGSTLLTRMMRACGTTVATSEPEPLDAVLRWIAAAQPETERAGQAIRAMIAALGRQGAGQSDGHIVKLELWHSLFLPELQAALPGVNWVFVYRDPVEVLVSQLHQPGIHIVPGALDEARLGIAGYNAASQADYAAKVLGRCIEGAIAGWPSGRGLALDYTSLRNGGAEAAARHFGLPLDAGRQAAMALAAQTDAKSPGQPFVDDRARKRAEADDQIRQAAKLWVEQPFDQIVAMNRSQE